MPNPSEMERVEQERQTYDRGAPTAAGELGDVCVIPTRDERLKLLEVDMQRFDKGDIVPPAAESHFEKELEQLINKYSMENGSNTPDFLLARYLRLQLDLFERCVRRREHWFGRVEELVPWREPTNG